MPLKVRCPACNKKVKVDDREVGQQTLCPACGNRFEVPVPPLLGPFVPGQAEQDDAGDPIDQPQATVSAPEFAVDDSPADSTAAPALIEIPQVVPPPPSEGPFVPSVQFAVEIPLPLADEVEPRADRAVLSERAESNRPAVVDFQGESATRWSGLHPVWWAAALLGCAVVVLAIVFSAGMFDNWDKEHFSELKELKTQAEALAAKGQMSEAHQKYTQLHQMVEGRTLRYPSLLALVEQAEADRRRVYSVILAQMMERESQKLNDADSSVKNLTLLPPSPSIARPAQPAPTATGVPPPPAADATVPAPLMHLPVVPASSNASGRSGPPDPAATIDADRPDPAPPGPLVKRPQAVLPGHERPEPHFVAPTRDELTDQQVGAAIQRGVDFLLAQFNPRTSAIGDREQFDAARYAGMNSLAVYALLQSGQAISDPRLNVRGAQMAGLLNALKPMSMDGYSQTYARALRSTCLALFNRPDDYVTLQDDADYLMGACIGGAYTYSVKRVPRGKRSFGPSNVGWDNSNSQYGLLGVWSATDAEPRIEVPGAYWRAVQKHWNDCQLPDGQWGYVSAPPRSTMTCAGIASLLVAHEYLEPMMTADSVGREPFTPQIKKALNWFEKGDNSIQLTSYYWGYSLYGVERVGLASGFKQFGTHDWYRELAAKTVKLQQPDGSWGDVIETSYALLFLSRGRHPILMNKLRFDHRGDTKTARQSDSYWDNRPRDLSNLARYAGRQLERPINWQIVSIDNPWTDWADSPILYFASHKPPKFSDADCDKLRSFVESGGMIYTQADAASAPFSAWVGELAHRLFPKYEMTDLGADHPLYNVVFKPSPRPALKAVSNGARLLMVHCPADIALGWQNRQDRAWEGIGSARKAAQEPALRGLQLGPYQLGVNLFVYAAGKRDLRNRIDPAWVEPVTAAPLTTIPIARVQYAGNWDPEPGAWRRYANWFQQQTDYKLDVREVRLSDLKNSDAPLAHLTGTARYTFTAEEITAVRKYVEAGGVLLVDTCGGTGAFDRSIVTLMTTAFPNNSPKLLAPAHPLLNDDTPGTEVVSRPRLRPFTIERLGSHVGELGVVSAGKGHALLTNLDITCGLLGTNTWGILGYEPSYAQSLLKNIVFWVLDGQPAAVSPDRPRAPLADRPSSASIHPPETRNPAESDPGTQASQP